VAAPIYEVHVPLPGDPQRILEAPVVEVIHYKTADREVNPDAVRPAAETQEMMRRMSCREELPRVQGFIAISWGIAIEDGSRGVYLIGWRSVEVRSFAHALSSLIPCVPMIVSKG